MTSRATGGIKPRRANAINLIFSKIDEKLSIEASRSNDLFGVAYDVP